MVRFLNRRFVESIVDSHNLVTSVQVGTQATAGRARIEWVS
jgi:hypothetical protein